MQLFRGLVSSGFRTICVAGAGRGPLVARALNALQRAKKDAKIIAVEKNPNAFVTCVLIALRTRASAHLMPLLPSLQRRQSLEWGDKVTLVYGDMRALDVPEPADILVSELLGSFGDNELSPECLDGAQRFLKRECGRDGNKGSFPADDLRRFSGWNFDTLFVYRTSSAIVVSEAIQRGAIGGVGGWEPSCSNLDVLFVLVFLQRSGSMAETRSHVGSESRSAMNTTISTVYFMVATLS